MVNSAEKPPRSTLPVFPSLFSSLLDTKSTLTMKAPTRTKSKIKDSDKDDGQDKSKANWKASACLPPWDFHFHLRFSCNSSPFIFNLAMQSVQPSPLPGNGGPFRSASLYFPFSHPLSLPIAPLLILWCPSPLPHFFIFVSFLLSLLLPVDRHRRSKVIRREAKAISLAMGILLGLCCQNLDETSRAVLIVLTAKVWFLSQDGHFPFSCLSLPPFRSPSCAQVQFPFEMDGNM